MTPFARTLFIAALVLVCALLLPGARTALATDPLPTLQGGTGTTTAYDRGVLFYNATLGTYSQAGNGGFIYDYVKNLLGVGTTSPSAVVSVSTLQQQSGALPLFSVGSTTGATLFTVLGNGKVGIGTAQPPSLFSVSQADNSTLLNTAVNALALINTDATANNFDFMSFRASDASGTQQAVGRLGMQITSHASGAQSADFIFNNRSAGTIGETMRITAAGQVGIGTSTPAAALDLEGQLRLKTYPLASLPAVGAYFGKVTRAANGLDGTPGILVSDESGQWYPITPIHRIAATSTLTVLGVGASPIGKLFNSNDGSNGGQVQFDTTLNASFPGANVVFLNAGSSGAGETPYGNPTTYFFDPITGADGPSYAKMIRVASTSSTVDAVIWGGAGDLLALASSTESRNEYKDHLRTLLTRIHTQYNAPIFLLYPNSGTSTPGISSFMGVTDSAMQIAREVEKELSTEMGFVYSGAESYDLAVSTDGYHVGDPGLVTEGQRLARSIANYYGANLTGTQGPKIVSAVHTDATHITVTVQHDAGTDFTVPPGGQFDGFKLLDGANGFITVTSAARSTATTLTLTLASPPASGNETLYYAYGLSVPNPSLGGYDFVEDNASSVTGGLDPTMPLQSAVVQVSGSLATTVDDHHLDTDTGGNTIFRNLTTELARLTSTGLFGLGTTSPVARLTVWGPDAASTTAFAVVNAASTTAFQVFDNGNATLAGSLMQNSDTRLKQDVAPLDASSTLAALASLNPVSYSWLDPARSTAPQFGFIAQEVQHIFPNLVSTTSPTTLTPDGTLSLNYLGLIAPMVEAIKTLAAEVNATAQSVTTEVVRATTGYFDTGYFSQQICVGSTCINEAQLKVLLQNAGQ